MLSTRPTQTPILGSKSFRRVKLVTWILGIALTQWGHVQPAVAQTHATEHQQNFDEKTNSVHASGIEADESKSFIERYAPPKPLSSFGQHIDNIFAYTSWATFVFFVLMASSLLYFVIAYRKRPGHKAYYTHGNHLSEKTVAKLLDIAVFLTLDCVLIYFSWADTRNIVWNYPDTSDTVKVMIMPQQWVWNFKYAGNDGKFGTADDIDTINELRVPEGKPVLIQMKSKDVIHGFNIPNVRMQVDAIPGSVTKFWFDTNRTGDFEIACYHHCGTSHYKMKAFLKVMKPEDFKSWSEEASNWAQAKFDADDKATQWNWNWGL